MPSQVAPHGHNVGLARHADERVTALRERRSQPACFGPRALARSGAGVTAGITGNRGQDMNEDIA